MNAIHDEDSVFKNRVQSSTGKQGEAKPKPKIMRRRVSNENMSPNVTTCEEIRKSPSSSMLGDYDSPLLQQFGKFKPVGTSSRRKLVMHQDMISPSLIKPPSAVHDSAGKVSSTINPSSMLRPPRVVTSSTPEALRTGTPSSSEQREYKSRLDELVRWKLSKSQTESFKHHENALASRYGMASPMGSRLPPSVQVRLPHVSRVMKEEEKELERQQLLNQAASAVFDELLDRAYIKAEAQMELNQRNAYLKDLQVKEDLQKEEEKQQKIRHAMGLAMEQQRNEALKLEKERLDRLAHETELKNVEKENQLKKTEQQEVPIQALEDDMEQKLLAQQLSHQLEAVYDELEESDNTVETRTTAVEVQPSEKAAASSPIVGEVLLSTIEQKNPPVMGGPPAVQMPSGGFSLSNQLKNHKSQHMYVGWKDIVNNWEENPVETQPVKQHYAFFSSVNKYSFFSVVLGSLIGLAMHLLASEQTCRFVDVQAQHLFLNVCPDIDLPFVVKESIVFSQPEVILSNGQEPISVEVPEFEMEISEFENDPVSEFEQGAVSVELAEFETMVDFARMDLEEEIVFGSDFQADNEDLFDDSVIQVEDVRTAMQVGEDESLNQVQDIYESETQFHADQPLVQDEDIYESEIDSNADEPLIQMDEKKESDFQVSEDESLVQDEDINESEIDSNADEPLIQMEEKKESDFQVSEDESLVQDEDINESEVHFDADEPLIQTEEKMESDFQVSEDDSLIRDEAVNKPEVQISESQAELNFEDELAVKPTWKTPEINKKVMERDYSVVMGSNYLHLAPSIKKSISVSSESKNDYNLMKEDAKDKLTIKEEDPIRASGDSVWVLEYVAVSFALLLTWKLLGTSGVPALTVDVEVMSMDGYASPGFEDDELHHEGYHDNYENDDGGANAYYSDHIAVEEIHQVPSTPPPQSHGLLEEVNQNNRIEADESSGLFEAIEFSNVTGTPYVQMRTVRRSRRTSGITGSSPNLDTPIQFAASRLVR